MSVITATLNLIEAGREESYRQMVRSLRAQEGVEVEHVVADGASSDGTMALIEELGAEAVLSEPDGGVYEAMNRGAARVTGDYLLFLNSDDFLHRADGLSDLAAVAAGAPDFVAAPVISLDEAGGETELAVSRFYLRVLVSMPFCHQGLAVRRDLFERLGGFDTRYRILGDYDFVLRMFLGGAGGVLMARPFATFRPGGLSSDRAAMAAEYREIRARTLPGTEGLSEADWAAAEAARTLPRPVLRAIAGDPGLPSRMRWIARWYLAVRRG